MVMFGYWLPAEMDKRHTCPAEPSVSSEPTRKKNGLVKHYERGPKQADLWLPQAIHKMPFSFTAQGVSAIIVTVEIHCSASGRKDGCPHSREARIGGVCESPCGKFFPEGVLHITSSIIEAIGILGSVSSIAALLLYLRDERRKKK